MQDTSVDPAGKLEPLLGEQTMVTGADPPVTIGAGYVTIAGAVVTCALCESGQVILGGSVDGVGRDGEPHEVASRTHERTAR